MMNLVTYTEKSLGRVASIMLPCRKEVPPSKNHIKSVILNGYILHNHGNQKVAQKILFIANLREETGQLGVIRREWAQENSFLTKSVQLMKFKYEKLISKI